MALTQLGHLLGRALGHDDYLLANAADMSRLARWALPQFCYHGIEACGPHIHQLRFPYPAGFEEADTFQAH